MPTHSNTHIGLAPKAGFGAPDRILQIDHERVGAHAQRAILLEGGDFLHRDRGAEALGPERDCKADRTGAEHQGLVARLERRQVDPVQRHRQRLDDGAVGKADLAGQLDALVGPRERVLGVASALQAEPRAPLHFALAAMLARPAALERDDRDEVAGAQALGLAAEADHFASELVPEHVAVPAAESWILGQVQVAAANPAAAHLDHDLARLGRRIGQGLVRERSVQRLERDRFHLASGLTGPSCMPPSIITWLPVM